MQNFLMARREILVMHATHHHDPVVRDAIAVLQGENTVLTGVIAEQRTMALTLKGRRIVGRMLSRCVLAGGMAVGALWLQHGDHPRHLLGGVREGYGEGWRRVPSVAVAPKTARAHRDSALAVRW